MAIDVFSSLRSTALVTLVAASFSSPIVVKSDAFANASAKLTGSKGAAEQEQAPPEQIIAGGVQFEMPGEWGRLGASAASSGTAKEAIGTVVTGLCPGGSSGATCTDETKLTFVAYTGRDDHELPLLVEFEDQLDGQLAKEFPGFKRGEAKQLPGADGIRYLDYTFTWKQGAAQHTQRVAAYRHSDGSGVVVLGAGPKLAEHDKGIDAFLASGHEPVDGEA